MALVRYRYLLRDGDEIAATGLISLEEALEVGDEVTIGSSPGRVVEVGATLTAGESRLVVDLLPGGSGSEARNASAA
jgi:hypothetical protein